MFGGYTEIVAYSKVSPRKSWTRDKLEDHTGTSTVMKKDQHSSCDQIASAKGQTPDLKLNDFILLAECSELCGPVPVITVPQQVGEFIDISTLVVQLMSTDLQGVGRTIIYPSEDLQLLTMDLIPGWHALTNYFTVVDLHARGFVRPASIAYLTQDKRKLIINNASLRESLKQAAHTIKCSAMKSFMTDWNHMQGADETEVQKIGKRNSVNLSSSTKELGHILNVIATCLTENVELGREIDHMLKLVHQNTCAMTNREVHLLLKVNNSPTLSKSSSIQNLGSSLRPLIELCTGGFLLGLHHLYKIQQYYSKTQEGITLHSQECSDKGVLHFGVCPKIVNSTKNTNEGSSVDGADGVNAKRNHLEAPIPVVDSFKNVLANDLDDGFLTILFNLCSNENLRDILSASGLLQDEPHACILQNETQSNQECFPLLCDKDQDKHICVRHTTQLNNMWSVQEELKHIDVESVLCKVLKMKYPSQLFFSLLMGRLFVVTGPPQMKKDVEALVNFLGFFIPHRKWKDLWKKPWCMSFIQSAEMKSVMIIGVGLREGKRIENMMPTQYLTNASVLDLKRNVFKGPKYEGILLRDFDRKLTCVEGVDSLLPIIISILLDIERKAFLWWLSLQDYQRYSSATAKKSPSAKLLSSQGYSRLDLTLLKRLAELLNEDEET